MKGNLTMNNQNKITFIGEDRRQYVVARLLSQKGYYVCFWGEGGEDGAQGIYHTSDPQRAFGDASAVVLPLPASTDGVTLNSKGEGRITLEQIASRLRGGTALVGGKLPTEFKELLESKSIGYLDYFESEAFKIKNAYVSAEAALFVAMEKLERTVRGARCAITGYGRIAKNLASLLLSLGAEVSVFARKQSDRVWAELSGAESFPVEDGGASLCEQLCVGYDVIFNTVPKRLFGEEFLRAADANTLIIELASAPGGVDVLAARKLGSNVLWASSLPAKYAPQSAGELVCESIEEILRGGVGR